MDIQKIKSARKRIASYVVETPLIQSLEFPNLYLKCENFQWTGSYKPRGAINAALRQITAGTGIVARSSGNFAQGIAYAGRVLGFQVTVVMPENAPQLKIDGTKKLGADVVQFGTTHAEGYQKVQELIEQGKGVLIHAFDDSDVIAGQGTIALETLDQLDEVSHFFGPVGGGGLMAGCATAIKSLSVDTEVIAVEPEGAASLNLSLRKGKRESLSSTKTIADGLLSPTVGEHNWPLLERYVDIVISITEDEIIEAMRILFHTFGIVAEPSGAVSFAGYLKERPQNGNVVCVISGGNVDRKRFLEWIALSPSSVTTV